MKVKELRESLSQFDDNMEILYYEPIIGALVPFLDTKDTKFKKKVAIQTKDGDWFTENEFSELKSANEKFDSDILNKKEQVFLFIENNNSDDNDEPLFDSAGYSIFDRD